LLILDANILIRAVLGNRVRSLLARYGSAVEFLAPETAFQEARKHLPVILGKRNIAPLEGLEVLHSLSLVVQSIEPETYAAFEQTARVRLRGRDEADWPILAAALALGCPIWTEDADFFGAGVATWTSDRVELFLQAASSAH
jgi:predicted nucleic acid-binding protein